MARRSRDEARRRPARCPGPGPWSRRWGRSPASSWRPSSSSPAPIPARRSRRRSWPSSSEGSASRRSWDLCDKRVLQGPGGRDPLAEVDRSRRRRSAEDPGRHREPGPRSDQGPRAARPHALPQQAAKEAGLRFDWQARRYQQQARNYSMAQLLVLHERITEADRALEVGRNRRCDHARADRRDRGVGCRVTRRRRRWRPWRGGSCGGRPSSCARCPCWRPCPRRGRPRGPSACAASASPSAMADWTFFVEVFSEVRTALFRSCRTRFCLFRLICDLMFAIRPISLPAARARRSGHGLPHASGPYHGRFRDHRHLPHPQLLHRGAHRPRQVDAGRPPAGGHAHGRRSRHARPVPGQDGPGARARHHDQGPVGPPGARGLRAEPDRHARAMWTSPTRSRAPSPPARARCCWSMPPRAWRPRRWRTTTWRATPGWSSCRRSTRSTCPPPSPSNARRSSPRCSTAIPTTSCTSARSPAPASTRCSRR